MQDLKNIQYVVVAKNIARQATTIKDKFSATYIKDGEVVITDLNNNVITATEIAGTLKDRLKIVIRKGDSLISSPAIKKANLSKYLVKGYVAPVKQVSYLGYNGISGSFEGGTLTAGTDYLVTLRKKTLRLNTYDSHFDNKTVNYYNESATTNAQNQLADGLIQQLVANFTDQFNIDNYVIFERLASTGDTALGAGTLALTNGSRNVLASSASHGLVAGDYIRAATGTTNAVYKVEKVSGTAIILDIPYQGVTAPTVAARKVSTPTVANWGIKITGNDKGYEAVRFSNDQFKFEIFTENFNIDPVQYVTPAFLGSGSYGEVSDKEWFNFGANFLGFAEKNMPPRTKSLNADDSLTGGYNWIVVSAYNNDHASIHSRPESPFEILVAIPTGANVGHDQADDAGSGKAAGIATVFDAWLAKTESAKLV